MAVGHFLGGIGALIWNPADDTYLLLKRSSTKDVGADHWECVTGRVDQGESFEEALHREVGEEIGIATQIEFIIGTTHFYRGESVPENELLGVLYCCTSASLDQITLSNEHSEYRWVTAEEAYTFIPPDGWLKRTLQRAEVIRSIMPPALHEYYRQNGFEIG